MLAEPRVDTAYTNDSQCPPSKVPVVIILTTKQVANGLVAVAHRALVEGDFATAALAHNELFVRQALQDPKAADNDRLKTIESFGRFLALSEEPLKWDPRQQQQVPSPALVNAIKVFQDHNALTPTGVLDYKTLSLAAGLSTTDLLAIVTAKKPM